MNHAHQRKANSGFIQKILKTHNNYSYQEGANKDGSGILNANNLQLVRSQKDLKGIIVSTNNKQKKGGLIFKASSMLKQQKGLIV